MLAADATAIYISAGTSRKDTLGYRDLLDWYGQRDFNKSCSRRPSYAAHDRFIMADPLPSSVRLPGGARELTIAC